MRFKDICRKSEMELKTYLHQKLDMEWHDGFLYRKGTEPILLVAHMDTIHKETPKVIADKRGVISSPQGIGGDDRCGIYMIMQILKKHDCHVVFTEQEEVGGIGASKFCASQIAKTLTGKINYAIELDRRDANDAVFYECGNTEFKDFILADKFWKEANGSYTDICDIAPVLDCSAVNFSCGYHNAHTTDEYVDMREMQTALEHVIKTIERSDGKHYEWAQEKCKSLWKEYDWYGGYSCGGEEFNIIYLNRDGDVLSEIIYGDTLEEAVGMFLMEHPDVCFNDVQEIYDCDFENQYF